MSLLVTGSIGIDTVTTPYGKSQNCLGGSAIYFSLAASLFSPVRFSGAVGEDCPFDLREVFAGRDVDLTGLEVREQSKTFRWKGSYQGTMDQAITDNVELNVLAEAQPMLPDKYKDSKFVFLANTAPALQLKLLEQVDKPTFVAADTMNCWIDTKLDDLKCLLKKIDCLILNETEARMLAGDHNLIISLDKILEMGPKVVIIKKGESGSVICDDEGQMFVLLAWPARDVKDPTGAGDSFAGGLMGYMAKQNKTDFETIKTAIAYGTVVSSFTISDFSINALAKVTPKKIEQRLKQLRKLTHF